MMAQSYWIMVSVLRSNQWDATDLPRHRVFVDYYLWVVTVRIHGLFKAVWLLNRVEIKSKVVWLCCHSVYVLGCHLMWILHA